MYYERRILHCCQLYILATFALLIMSKMFFENNNSKINR